MQKIQDNYRRRKRGAEQEFECRAGWIGVAIVTQEFLQAPSVCSAPLSFPHYHSKVTYFHQVSRPLIMATPQTNQETPVHIQSVHTDVSYESGQLENARMAVLDDLGPIPQITFQDFLKFLAPPQPAFDFDSTMESLKKDPEVTLPSGRWSLFETDPKDRG